MSVQFTATDWLDIASAFNYNAAFTITAWIRPENTNTWEGYAGISGAGGGSTWGADNIENDGANPNHLMGSVNLGGSYTGSVTSASTYSANAWHFVAYRRLSATQVDMWVDAALAGTGATADTSGRSISGLVFSIAAWSNNGSPGSNSFVGRMAQVRVWTTNLTDGELATEKASATAVKTASKWAFYELATAGSKTTDSSGNGRTLTAHGAGMTTGADDPVQTGAGASPAVKLRYRSKA